MVTDEFLEWEERDSSISLLKHCIAGKYPFHVDIHDITSARIGG